jgi:hypothetical protein
MLSLNSIWTETGRRVMIDGEVNLWFLPAAMATDNSLQEYDVVLMVPLIGAGRSCIGESTRGRAAAEEEGSPALWSGGSGGRN